MEKESLDPSGNQPTSIVVSNVQSSVVTIGHQNLVQASIAFKKLQESDVKADQEGWKQILTQLDLLQAEVKKLSDDYEELRDVELIPEVAQAKKEAKVIVQNPETPKKSFIEKLGRISEVAGKIIDVGAKLSPFILAIGKILGITI